MFDYLNIALTFITISLACSMLSYFVFRQQMAGGFLGAFIVATIGSVVGGVLAQVLDGVIKSLSKINSVNVFAAIIAAGILLWLFSKVSGQK